MTPPHFAYFGESLVRFYRKLNLVESPIVKFLNPRSSFFFNRVVPPHFADFGESLNLITQQKSYKKFLFANPEKPNKYRILVSFLYIFKKCYFFHLIPRRRSIFRAAILRRTAGRLKSESSGIFAIFWRKNY